MYKNGKGNGNVTECSSDAWINLYLCGIIFHSKAEGFEHYREVGSFRIVAIRTLKIFLQQ